MRDNKELEDADDLRSRALKAEVKAGEPALHALLVATRNKGASDFHLSVSQPPILRIGADLVRAKGDPFTAEKTLSMLKEILTEEQWEQIETSQQLDFCYYIPGAGRYRANVFEDQKGLNGVFRSSREAADDHRDRPARTSLRDRQLSPGSRAGLWPCRLRQVDDPGGSRQPLQRNPARARADHGGAGEFVHPFKNCLINQREIGNHTQSFSRALRGALREDPDVIVIGDLRDNETVSLALTAAETGHIVLGTLNSTNAPKAVDRLISSFSVEEQPQIRSSLAESLKFVIAQRLLRV